MGGRTKQVIVFRKDLLKGEHSIRKGKFAGQVAHASLAALLKCFNKEKYEPIQIGLVGDAEPGQTTYRYEVSFKEGSLLDDWLNGIFTKVVVSVENEDELNKLEKELIRMREEDNSLIPYAVITDCGNTEFHGVPTKTCIGIGPYMSEDIDKLTGNLPLL